MSVKKGHLQEFQHQIKDIRTQLYDQIKCLEQRTDTQVTIYHEIQDFFKKRAELDLEYSKQLDKLVKSVMLKHKGDRQKRTNWTLFSACTLWQQLVDDTKEEAKQRAVTADVYGNYVTSAIASRCGMMQKLSKKCREIGVLAQGEIVRVLNELHTAMKTYQLCYAEFNNVDAKLQQAEAVKNKAQDSSSVRKQRLIQKNIDKKSVKFEAAKLKTNRSRNEYLLCIDAANAALHKFFADDLSDLVDCTDLGTDCWLDLVLGNVIAARKAVCQTEMNSLANLSGFKENLQTQADKQRFFESNSSTFMLPKRFEFRSEPNEKVSKVSVGEGIAEDLKQRHHQIKKRLATLRTEADAIWKSLEETEQRIRALLAASTHIEVGSHGINDRRPPTDSLESELNEANEQYLKSFGYYLFNANLIMRLEARADGIGSALSGFDLQTCSLVSNSQSREPSDSALEWQDRSRRKRRIGSATSSSDPRQSHSSPKRRPRLFGGSLEEYVEATGEEIPLIVTSCIRVLSQFALHHQGLFRVSGSQVEINHMKEAFEIGDDPLRDVYDASDVNSIAGVLKLYLRELREPLFPFYLFELLTDCAKCATTEDFIAQIPPLLNKLRRPTYLLLRYLFAFLNHLSEFSDENMMDPYNLAICFGPTLLPIPEGKDQVYYQNFVNEVVKNLIVHHEAIFSTKVPGPRYEKYNVAGNNDEIELFADDTDEYFGTGSAASSTGNGTGNPSDIVEMNPARYANQSVNHTASWSNYSSDRSTSSAQQAGGRAPPTVTATLVTTNAVPGATYCYSSSENGSGTHLDHPKTAGPPEENTAPLPERSTGARLVARHSTLPTRPEPDGSQGRTHEVMERKRRSSTLSGDSSASSAAQTTIIANPTFNHTQAEIVASSRFSQAVYNDAQYDTSTATNPRERRRTSPHLSYSISRSERMRVPVAPKSLARTFSSDSSTPRVQPPFPSQSGGPPPYNSLYGARRASPPPPPPGPTSTVVSPRLLSSDFEKVNLALVSPRSLSQQSSPGSGSSTARNNEATPRAAINSSDAPKAVTTSGQKPDLVCNLPSKSSPAGSTSSAVSTGADAAGGASLAIRQ